MTKPAGYIPQLCLHKPTGQGYVRLDGRAFYLGKWGSPDAEREYDRLIAEWVANGRRLPTDRGRPGEYTLDDLIADFWVHAEKWYRRADGTPTGEIGNLRYALKPLRKLYGHMPITRFGTTELKTYREVLIDSGRCRTVVNQQVGIVRRVFKWGVSEQRVPTGVAFALSQVSNLPFGRSRARESVPVQPISDNDMRAVLPHVSRQIAAMIQLQWLTAMRPGEVVAMLTSDLDKSRKIWIYAPVHHKTKHHGKERWIPVGPQGQAILNSFLKLDREAHLFAPRDAVAELRERKTRARKSPMTPSQQARGARSLKKPKRAPRDRYSVGTYAQAIARACKKHGIPAWSPNQLRHSAATRIRKEYGIEVAQVVMGHSSLRTTEIYAAEDREAAMRVMEQFG